MWLDSLVVCDCGFSLSAVWCPLSVPTVLRGFHLLWMWGLASGLLQQSTATAPDLWPGVAPLGHACMPSQPPRFHMYALMFDIRFSLSDLLHSLWQFLGPFMSLQMMRFHSSYGWIIFHCVYVPLLLIHLSLSCLLWIVLNADKL